MEAATAPLLSCIAGCAKFLLGTSLAVWLLPRLLAGGSLNACQAAKHSQGLL